MTALVLSDVYFLHDHIFRIQLKNKSSSKNIAFIEITL